MESINELRIDLYPENKPKSELEKESIQKILNEDILAHSFDDNQKLGYLCYKVPVLSGFFNAYCNHYPIRIKPDDIWLLILQCFSYHVNENSKKLKNVFVNFLGEKELKISIECLEIGKKHLEVFVEEINKQMQQFLGNELLEVLTPNFTTTDDNSKLVCKISIMNTFKKYFRYTFDLISCGIPYIILEGIAEDYKKIITKAKNLRKYDFEWYIDRLIPIMQKMVDAKEGNIDVNFFKNIIHKEEAVVGRYEGCCCFKYKINYINGWILKFFGYIKYDDSLIRFLDDKIEGDLLNKFPNQILNIPFIIEKEDGTKKNMKFEAGFFGCEQNDEKEVYPIMGWLVTSGNSYDKGKKDKQFDVKIPYRDETLDKMMKKIFENMRTEEMETEKRKKEIDSK